MTFDSTKSFLIIPENHNNLKFSSNFQYRNYLTKKGNNIININNNNFYLDQLLNCNYQNIETPLTNNSPIFFNKDYLNIKPNIKPYGYTASDLKNNFINKRIVQYAHDDIRIFNI